MLAAAYLPLQQRVAIGCVVVVLKELGVHCGYAHEQRDGVCCRACPRPRQSLRPVPRLCVRPQQVAPYTASREPCAPKRGFRIPTPCYGNRHTRDLTYRGEYHTSRQPTARSAGQPPPRARGAAAMYALHRPNDALPPSIKHTRSKSNPGNVHKRSSCDQCHASISAVTCT